MLTVSQLIEILKSKPQNMRVVVTGYEGGCDDLTPLRIEEVRILLNTPGEWFNGSHEIVDFLSDPADEIALIFSR
jgi:hypothetical protein